MEWLTWLVAAVILGRCLGEGEMLFVKYDLPSLDPHRVDSFFELPRMRSAAESDGWALVEDRIMGNGYAILCRNNDYRVCLLYDVQGSIAGVQVSLSVDDVKRSATPYPMDIIPMQEKKRVLDTDVYAATVLFVGDGVLMSGGRILSKDTKIAPNGMYYQFRDGERRFVPRSDKDLDGTPYRKQACKNAMGRHYYYNISTDLECSDMETFAPIYDEWTGELVAAAYLAFGRSSTQWHGRRWFESTSGPGFKLVVPDSPECLSNWIDAYGLVAFHIYVHNEPWNIYC